MKITENETRSKQKEWHALTAVQLGICCASLAIICIFAPGFRPTSRIAHNERTAVRMLKLYAQVQEEVALRKFTVLPCNDSSETPSPYVADYRILYYGHDENGIELRRIPQGMANACLVPDIDATRHSHQPEHMPYEGYWFCEAPSSVSTPDGENSHFALMAFPARLHITGMRIFWIGSGGKPYAMEFANTNILEKATATEQFHFFSETPSSFSAFETNRLFWKRSDPDEDEQHWLFWKKWGNRTATGFCILAIAAFVVAHKHRRRR